MINLIPKPLEVNIKEGKIPFSSQTQLCGDFANMFAAMTEMMSGLKSNSADNKLVFVKDGTVKQEGYEIVCDGTDISVKAADENGAFYAVMTLIQLADKDGYIQNVDIKDAPRYHHRGFMLDCARHFWTVDQIKMMLDVMANLKMNIFHWHLTEDQGWRIEIKKYPLLTEKGSIRKSTALSLTGYEEYKEPRDYTEYGRGLYYTQEQVKDVVAYAKARCIDIIPEIDMPGHFVAAIACYPHLSCAGEQVEVSDRWGVMDNIACCGKEDIYNFVKDIIDELCELFPYPYFHIGGDEVPKTRWEKCPACQAKIKELGLKDENALQAYFNNIIAAYLKQKGRHTVGWNEILESSENLDRGIVPQWWIKLDDSVREKKWLAEGNKILLSMVDYVYMDHAFAIRPLEKTYGFGPEAMGIEDNENILGVEAPQWTEYIRDYEKFSMNTYARMAAISEVAWTAAGNKDYADFENRLENMRGYFSERNADIAPQVIYRGDTIGEVKPEERMEKAWETWKNDPYFEVKIMHEMNNK